MYICSAYYAMSEETQEIDDNMEITAGTTCTWKDMRYVVIFAENIETLVGIYAHEPSSSPYKLLMHTLTETNVKKKLLVITLFVSAFIELHLLFNICHHTV
jgi:hypothetical protein